MKYKVSELEGALLDAAVAKAADRLFTLEGFGSLAHLAPLCWAVGACLNEGRGDYWAPFSPSSSWADGGPIIEREQICLNSEATTLAGFIWQAMVPENSWVSGATPLVAAMRAYVASKFGEEVELP